MSGGPYGRGKAPERACMKIDDWPDEDRRLWLAARACSDPFEPDGGTRANYATDSNRKVEAGYGRWLTFLSCNVDFDREARPTARITIDVAKAYAAHLRELGNAYHTVLARLQELGDFAVAVDPDFDRRPLHRLASRIRAVAGPSRDKRSKLVTTDRLLRLGLRLMEEATALTQRRRRAMRYRDGLLIALLALRPLRRRNLAGLTITKSLCRIGERRFIAIDGEETKTGRPIHMPWPEILEKHLDTYLGVHRPVLVEPRGRRTAPVCDALWVSSRRTPMTGMAIYDAVRGRTKAAFGKAVNLHLFRDAAATTLAVIDPIHIRSASPLLGHRSQATTERYYQQAQSIEAHREFVKLIERMRSAG